MRQVAFCTHFTGSRRAPRAASQGQKPVANFLNEAGQIRLGKRQARRQAKIVAGARFKIARTPAQLGYTRREQNVYRGERLCRKNIRLIGSIRLLDFCTRI